MKKFLVLVTVLLFFNFCVSAQNDTTLYSDFYYFVLNGKVQTNKTIDTFSLTYTDSTGNQIKISGKYEIGKITFKSKDIEKIKFYKFQKCNIEFCYRNPKFFKKSRKYKIENINFFSNCYLEIIDTPENPPGYGYLMTNGSYFRPFNIEGKYYYHLIYD
jgi:hypothetical protein